LKLFWQCCVGITTGSLMKRLVLAFVTLSIAVGCPGKNLPPQTAASAVNTQSKAEPEGPPDLRLSKSGLGFRLSNAEAERELRKGLAQTTPLTEAETKALLARLPALEQSESMRKEFAFREKSTPAPRPGKTTTDSFPPPPSSLNAPAVPNTALTVLRKMPTGTLEQAPLVSVTFSEPMVPVTSHDELGKLGIPITLTPEPKGSWQWAGTQTIVFKPEKQFPKATDYVVEIPAGIKSSRGVQLAQGEKFTFTLPAVKLLDFSPSGDSIKTSPILIARFDQAIEPAAVLSMVRVTANGASVPVRLATSAEIEADEDAERMIPKDVNAPKDRTLAFRTVNALPTSSAITVVFPAGLPSAEGPKRSSISQTKSFRTYDALRRMEAGCGSSVCRPGDNFFMRFNNELDAAQFDPSMVQVTPSTPGLAISAQGSVVLVSGRFKGRTQYTVTVSGDIKDGFGQALGKSEVATYAVGSAMPALMREQRPLEVLDPVSKAQYPIFSVNEGPLRYKLYAVTPSQFEAYESFRNAWDQDGKQLALPGVLVKSGVMTPKGEADTVIETPLDLSPAVPRGVGHVLVVVESQRAFKERWEKEWVRSWVQVTQLGVTVLAEGQSAGVWITKLTDGNPIQGAKVSTGSNESTSDTDGLAQVRLPFNARMVTATVGDDTAFWSGYFGNTGGTTTTHPHYFSFTDRQMYKPSEEVHVRGWVRDIDYSKKGDVGYARVNGQTLRYKVQDTRGAEFAKGETTIDDRGGYELKFSVPTTANAGYANISFETQATGTSGGLSFQIEEFRRPDFEVSASTSDGPHYVGRHAVATVNAKYYAGGGLASAKATWTVSKEQAHFAPPNHGEYSFGDNTWHPYNWGGDYGGMGYGRGKRFGGYGGRSQASSETWEGVTDAQGAHRLRVDLDVLEPSYPISLALNASVTDVNRQTWVGQTTLLVHPANVYAGIRAERAFVEAGQSFEYALVSVDVDGNRVAGRSIHMHSARIDNAQVKGKWTEVEKDVADCDVVSSADVSKCALKTGAAGSYRVTAIINDALGRKSQTTLTSWVTGNDDSKMDRTQAGEVELIAEKTSYKPGETAQILMRAPFAPAEGLLVIDRAGVVQTTRFLLKEQTQSIAVSLDETLVPGATVRVILAGQEQRRNAAGDRDPKLPPKPAHAQGELALKIQPVTRTLFVSAKARQDAVDPGGSTTLDVSIKDNAGKAVQNADVALYVVDEAVLALSGYKTPDPIEAFYPMRGANTQISDVRELLYLTTAADKGKLGLNGAGEGGGGLANPSKSLNDRISEMASGHGPDLPKGIAPPSPVAAASAAPGAQAPALRRAKDSSSEKEKKRAPNEPSQGAESTKAIGLRTDMRALALWAPKLRTDSSGHAETAIKLPDSTSRYRVMAVVAEGEKRFGSGESNLTTRLPLMVRATPPRFLNYGDAFELSLTVQNQTKAPLVVSVATRADNAEVPALGKRVTVPAEDRVEVRFPAAAKMPGTARFQAAVSAGSVADAATVDLPVWTPATTEAFATYGVIDNGAMTQAVKKPGGVSDEFGGLEITTSSTALFTLGEAFLYLVKYPYDCNEQLSSRILSIVALKDVLKAFKVEGLPPEDALAESVKEDLRRLKTRQHYTGGWGFWWHEPWPYLSIHVTHALVRAKEKGYDVDANMLTRAQQYLRTIESHIPAYYGPEARRSLIAYALYVRDRMKDSDPNRARSLIAESGGVTKTSLEALGWVWPTLAKANAPELAALKKHLANRVTETAGAAHFVTSYGDGDYLLLNSEMRADGILLESMIGDDPKNDVIPKLVAGLLGHRKAGRWGSTQENAFVLLALDKYFRTYENVSPNFVARAWLGDKYAGERAYKGYNTDRQEIRIPMKQLASLGNADLTLQKDGDGRMYYRLGMQYAPADLKVPAMERGFTVSRIYEAADKEAVVSRDADGTWHVKSGSLVRSRITMVSQARRHHVALVDPMPAGFEPMNAALAVTGPVPQDPKPQANPYDWWTRTWYEHQNLRDERAEAFASLLWDGVHEYVYTSRATTPGRFIVAPPKAEEMYSPEVFGRGKGDTVVVDPM
jgi:alpha-2-macroglobulin